MQMRRQAEALSPDALGSAPAPRFTFGWGTSRATCETAPFSLPRPAKIEAPRQKIFVCPRFTVHNDWDLQASHQLCPSSQDEELPWYQRRHLRLAPLCWPIVAFGPAAVFFFLMTLGACSLFCLLALLAGDAWFMFAVLTPVVLAMGIYPGFCAVWRRISRQRDLGLRIELIPAQPDAEAQDPYRALDKPSTYRVWYRGKIIEKGALAPGSLALKTYYFRPHTRKSEPDYVTSLVLRSKATKAHVWWFAFARHFEDDAYILVSRTAQGSAELCKQALALEQRLGLPEASIQHLHEYACPQAEQLVNKARALAEGPSAKQLPA